MTHLVFGKKDNYTKCFNSAVYSLAMREHSRLEIYNKLLKKKYSQDVNIDELVDELVCKDYLNERRFTESFIRYRSIRGQGPVKILNELKLRGISSGLINESLRNSNIDWLTLAKEQHQKKYGKLKPKEFKEKAKQTRFLLSRGFDFEIIQQILQ